MGTFAVHIASPIVPNTGIASIHRRGDSEIWWKVSPKMQCCRSNNRDLNSSLSLARSASSFSIQLCNSFISQVRFITNSRSCSNSAEEGMDGDLDSSEIGERLPGAPIPLSEPCSALLEVDPLLEGICNYNQNSCTE